MSIHQKILADAKEAMLNRDEVRSLVLKNIKATFTNELLAQSNVKKIELTDEEALAIIRRLVKQRKDSIEQFTKGGRKDLAKNEEAELEILNEYLPALMSETDVKKAVEKIVKGQKAVDKTKMGPLMASVMKELKGKADGAIVKKVVDQMFS